MEPLEGTMKGTPSPMTISTKLQRIATLAKEIPGPLNNLAHYIDIEWLFSTALFPEETIKPAIIALVTEAPDPLPTQARQAAN